MKCNLNIDNKPFSFDVEGEFFWGNDEVLFTKDSDSIVEKTDWKNEGYNIIEVLEPEEHKEIIEAISSVIKNIFKELGVKYDENNFNLENYHKYVDNDHIHNEVIKKTRFLRYSDFPQNLLKKISNKVSDDLQKPVSFDNPLLENEIVILRISRPNSLDINPPHRDGYLDIWENILNLWLPIIGCDENSSLPVIPKSHLWSEKDVLRTSTKGATINGLSYHVPAIIKTTHDLNMIRPNPKIGQVLIFTPYIIHGAAVNLNQDKTRMSLELRLYNK